MARRDREINIFNIAFLDVITGAMGAFVLLVVLLAPYYTGSDPRSRKEQQEAQSSVNEAQQDVQKAQQSAPQNDQQTQQALAQAQNDLADAKQQLDALKQQLDQLASQNKRISALDDQQQQQLKQAQQQISELQQQAQQSTQQALDRAEQNMQQADQAMQTGDVEKLKRLLAQARADLQAARQQLDALNKELDETRKDLKEARDENAALQQRLDQATAEIEDLKNRLARAQQALATAERQRDQAIAEAQQMRQELAAAQQQRNQAQAEAESYRQLAAGLKHTLNESLPTPVQWVIATVDATPACNNVGFGLVSRLVASSGQADVRGLTTAEENKYLQRGVIALPFGAPSGFSAAQPFHQQYLLTLPLQGARELVGLRASSAPSPGCALRAQFAMINTKDTETVTAINIWSSQIHLFRDMRPVLFSAIPPDQKQHYLPSSDDLAEWDKETQSAAPAQPGGANP